MQEERLPPRCTVLGRLCGVKIRASLLESSAIIVDPDLHCFATYYDTSFQGLGGDL